MHVETSPLATVELFGQVPNHAEHDFPPKREPSRRGMKSKCAVFSSGLTGGAGGEAGSKIRDDNLNGRRTHKRRFDSVSG